MIFSAMDLGGLLLAAALPAITLLAPGIALVHFFRLAPGSTPAPMSVASAAGLALMPGIASLIARVVGLDVAVAADLALAILGLWFLLTRRAERPRVQRAGFLLAAVWLAVVAVEWIDFDTGTKLFQPLTDFDTVKHAATTQALLDTGAPPRDAFFLRPVRSSYYYYFYTLAAITVRVSGHAVDARAAVGGLVFWTGVGVYGMIRFVLDRAGFPLGIAGKRVPTLVVAVLALGGLDLVMTLHHRFTRGEWLADPLGWNEQVGAWFQDILWVPHHVAALLAGTLGLAALCDAIAVPTGIVGARIVSARAIALAGLCFATAFGLSVWVTFGFVLTVAIWLVALGPFERRWSTLAPILAAGGLALVLSLPQLHDLAAGRAGGGTSPILPTVRRFAPVELWSPGILLTSARLAALPLNYAMEFGALLLGSIAFWRGPRGLASRSEFARALTLAAAAGLVGATFLRSTLYNNDLGWRLTLLPLLAGTVWTIVALDRWFAQRERAVPIVSPVFAATCILGWALVAYTAFMMRAYPFLPIDPEFRFMAADPGNQRDLRVAFAWAKDHLPPERVLQQNPGADRTLAFGLYGHNAVAVSDSFGGLYGADQAAVMRRLAALIPIFRAELGDDEVARIAAANGIDDFVVTAADPAWHDETSFVWHRTPLFATATVRIVPAGTLEAAR